MPAASLLGAATRVPVLFFRGDCGIASQPDPAATRYSCERKAPLLPPFPQRSGADAANGLDVVLTINATDDHGLDSICLSNTYVSGDACT